MSKKITLLGSTGSIGTQSLDVILALYTRMGWKLTSGTELEFTPEQYPAVVKKCALVWMRYEGSAQK